MISKPEFKDNNNFYVEFASIAVDTDLIKSLELSGNRTELLIDSVPHHLEDYKYQDGKWTIKQVIKHIVDTERIFSYRALAISKKDKKSRQSFNENFSALSDNSKNLSLKEIKEEFVAVRKSTIELFKTLSSDSLDFEETEKNMLFTPRIIGWLVSGHNTHHCSVIQSRYLTSA